MEKIRKILLLITVTLLTTSLSEAQTFDLTNNTTDGNVHYETSNPTSNAAQFIIFGDGSFSLQDNGMHQYPSSTSGFTASAHINPDYTLDPPTKLTRQTGSTGTGFNYGPNIGNVTFSKVALSWNACLNIENYFMLIIENDTPYPSSLSDNGYVEFYYHSNQLNLNTAGIITYNNVFYQNTTSASSSLLIYITKKLPFNFQI